MNRSTHPAIAFALPVQATLVALMVGLAPLAAADTAPADVPVQPTQPASAISAPLPLFDGHDLSSWWIDPEGLQPRIEGGELVVRLLSNKAFHAEVGGMSWDDYEVAGEFRIDPVPSGGGGFVNLQLCPHDTMIYAQLLGGSKTKIAYFEPGGRPFVESVQTDVPNPPGFGSWHRFSVLASGGVVATRVDGVATAAAVVPIGTMGKFGILANFANQVDLRMRSLTIAFLKPTTRQLQEYAHPVLKNWEAWVAERRAAGDTRPLDAKTLGKGLDAPEAPKPAKAKDAGF